VEELTALFEDDKDTVQMDIEARGMELKEILESFQKDVAEQRSDWLNREGRILKQMEDCSSDIFGTIQKSHWRGNKFCSKSS